jgi:hypothetical protein
VNLDLGCCQNSEPWTLNCFLVVDLGCVSRNPIELQIDQVSDCLDLVAGTWIRTHATASEDICIILISSFLANLQLQA